MSYLFVCAPKWPNCEVHPKEATLCHMRDIIHFYQDYLINVMSKTESPHCIIHVFVKRPSFTMICVQLSFASRTPEARLQLSHLPWKKIALYSTEKTRLCIRLQGKQLNSLCLHKSKHLGPPPKLISAAAFTDLIGFNQMIGAVGHKMRKHF